MHLFFVGDIVGLFVDGALVVGEVDGGNEGEAGRRGKEGEE